MENSSAGKVISFINMKGGVSKTTLCKELGLYLFRKKNKKILFVDVDPQANLTQSLFDKYQYSQKEMIYENEEVASKYTESNASIENMINRGSTAGPSYDDVVQCLDDQGLSIIPGELGIDFSLRNLNSSTLENSLYNFIRDNGLREKFDYILVDCPPTYSSYTVLALKPSDFYLIPVRPEAYSILGIDLLLQVVQYIQGEHDTFFAQKPLRNLGLIFTNIELTPSQGVENLIKEIKTSNTISEWGISIFDNYFDRNTQLPKDIGYFIVDSNSEISKRNLSLLADEFLNKIGLEN
ncbi:ParA family protein [Enterococcus innesii]|uniref:ParA family protein n=1 Tax=Enterococcus innesii TaxID=2839759 RepID=UPI003984B2D3